MNKLLLLALVMVLFTGCTTFHPSIPEGYSGSTATIKDSAKELDSGKADLFYLSHIDGKDIKNSRLETISASYGQGNYLDIVLLENTVPAEKQAFTIVGRTEYAMPIRALSGTVFEVKGEVTFSPIPNEAYFIKGVLSEKNSSVWIENISSGEIIKKIEVTGSSKLGFFEK